MILFTALLNYLAEISATWQLPPLKQLKMLRGIHSTEQKQAIFFIFLYLFISRVHWQEPVMLLLTG